MNGYEMIKLKNWAVVGDILNESKYAHRIFNKFEIRGYNVFGVHPKGGDGVYKSLKEVNKPIDAIDLCINNKLGIEFIKEANKLGIKYILIQPGAESDEILNYCKENDMVAIENCALVLLG